MNTAGNNKFLDINDFAFNAEFSDIINTNETNTNININTNNGNTPNNNSNNPNYENNKLNQSSNTSSNNMFKSPILSNILNGLSNNSHNKIKNNNKKNINDLPHNPIVGLNILSKRMNTIRIDNTTIIDNTIEDEKYSQELIDFDVVVDDNFVPCSNDTYISGNLNINNNTSQISNLRRITGMKNLNNQNNQNSNTSSNNLKLLKPNNIMNSCISYSSSNINFSNVVGHNTTNTNNLHFVIPEETNTNNTNTNNISNIILLKLKQKEIQYVSQIINLNNWLRIYDKYNKVGNKKMTKNNTDFNKATLDKDVLVDFFKKYSIENISSSSSNTMIVEIYSLWKVDTIIAFDAFDISIVEGKDYGRIIKEKNTTRFVVNTAANNRNVNNNNTNTKNNTNKYDIKESDVLIIKSYTKLYDGSILIEAFHK